MRIAGGGDLKFLEQQRRHHRKRLAVEIVDDRREKCETQHAPLSLVLRERRLHEWGHIVDSAGCVAGIFATDISYIEDHGKRCLRLAV